MRKEIKRLREVGMLEWICHARSEDPQEDYVPEDTPFNKDIRYALARSI